MKLSLRLLKEIINFLLVYFLRCENIKTLFSIKFKIKKQAKHSEILSGVCFFCCYTQKGGVKAKNKALELKYRRPGSLPAVGNPGLLPQSFTICKFIASVVQNVK